MLFLKYVFEKVDFEKNQQTTKIDENYPAGKEWTNTMRLCPFLHSFEKEFTCGVCLLGLDKVCSTGHISLLFITIHNVE